MRFRRTGSAARAARRRAAEVTLWNYQQGFLSRDRAELALAELGYSDRSVSRMLRRVEEEIGRENAP